MRTTAIVIALAALCLSSACCTAQTKVNVDAHNTPLGEVMADLAQQSKTAIVLDPKADGTVNINLTNVDLSQALSVITKMNNLTWRKVSYALPEGDNAALEQVKAAILTMAAISVTGLVVEDPTTNQCAVMAKNLPSYPETSAVKLPEGYVWQTFYVVTPPLVAASAGSGQTQSALQKMSTDEAARLQQLTAMTPEERKQYYANEMIAQMTLTPEARQALIRDRMEAMRDLDPQYRDQLRQDMRAAFGGRRPDGGGDRGNWGDRGDRRNN